MSGREQSIAVTGAGGYLGSRLVAFFRESGFRVVELRRDAADAGGPDGRPYALERGPDPDDLAGVGWLVHCAWDFRAHTPEETRAVNVAGATRLLDVASRARVSRAVVVSSMSAFPGCRSLYGRAKLEIESEALRRGALVVRPGLVFGRGVGGMLGRLHAMVSRLPVVPLVGGGRPLQYMAHADDVGRAIAALAEGGAPKGPVPLAHESPVTIAGIVDVLARAAGRRPARLPVPWRLAWAGLRGLEALGLRSRLSSDSVVSIMNQDPAPDFRPARELGIAFRPFDARSALR